MTPPRQRQRTEKRNYLGKPIVPTPEIKAEIARVRAEGNKAREEMEKFMASAGIPIPQKTEPTGPIYYILPQIEGLSSDGVKNVMEMTKLLAESGKRSEEHTSELQSQR